MPDTSTITVQKPFKDGQKLTDREAACLIYGYTRRMAEEAKEDGLFKELSVPEVIKLYLANFDTTSPLS